MIGALEDINMKLRLFALGVCCIALMTACDAPADDKTIDGDLSAPVVEGSAEASGGVNVGEEAAPSSDVPPPPLDVFHDESCDFESWIGLPLNEDAIKDTGRPYRILKPDDMMTMDHNPERINVEHSGGKVTRVWCG